MIDYTFSHQPCISQRIGIILKTNPLLSMTGLPPFQKIKPEYIEPAIDELIKTNRELVQHLLGDSEHYTWDNLIQPLEEADDRLGRAWSPVSHMNSVVNSDELREAYNACLPKLSEYSTEMGQNEHLFEAYKAFMRCPSFSIWIKPKKRLSKMPCVIFISPG